MQQKRFPKIIGIILGLVLVGGGAYYFSTGKELKNDSGEKNVSYLESENQISLTVDGENLQTIELNTDTQKAFEIIKEHPKAKKFITDLDVNFDGHNDVGVFTSTGYAGINNYYDFYIYDSKNKNLEKNEYLLEVSNPEIEESTKRIISTYKSAQDWYRVYISFNTGNMLDSNYQSTQYIVSKPIALSYGGITIERKGLESVCDFSNEDYAVIVEATLFGGIKFGALDPKVVVQNHIPEGGVIFSQNTETTICPKAIKGNKIYFEESVYDADLKGRIFLLDLDEKENGIQETNLEDINLI